MGSPIESLLQGDAAEFRDRVNDILLQKLGDRIDAERGEIASTLFGNDSDSDRFYDQDDAYFDEDEEEYYGDDE